MIFNALKRLALTLTRKRKLLHHPHLANNVFKRTVWNYKTCNIDGLVEALSSAPWDAGFNVFKYIDDIVTYWSSLLMQAAAEFITNTTVTVRAREKPWVSDDLKRLIRRRNVL